MILGVAGWGKVGECTESHKRLAQVDFCEGEMHAKPEPSAMPLKYFLWALSGCYNSSIFEASWHVDPSRRIVNITLRTTRTGNWLGFGISNDRGMVSGERHFSYYIKETKWWLSLTDTCPVDVEHSHSKQICFLVVHAFLLRYKTIGKKRLWLASLVRQR